MKIRWVLVMTVLVLLLGSVLTACGGVKDQVAPVGGGEATGLDGEALVQERCKTCHDLGRVEAAKKSTEEWQVTVERMVRTGAELNEEEQQAVIDYLAETYK